MSREEFIKALNTAATREFADVPDEDSIEWDFSESFLRKMQKLIRDRRRLYLRLVNTASKRAAAVAAVLLTLFAAGFGIKAVREPIVRIIKEAYRTFIGYSFEGDVAEEIKRRYYPHFIPDGFEKSYESSDEIYTSITFKNSFGKYIRFMQYATEKSDYYLDKERGNASIENIGDIRVTFYDDVESKTAFWTDDGYFFSIITDADIDLDILEKMIASVE